MCAMRDEGQDRCADAHQLMLADDDGHDPERDDRGDRGDDPAADRDEPDPPAR